MNSSAGSQNPKAYEDGVWLLESAMEQTTAGIAISDLDGRLLLVNNAFANSHGYTPDELVGKDLSIFHTPPQISAVDAANQELRDKGEFVGEIQHAHRDGTIFSALMCNSLLRDEAGNAVAMIGTMADISERARAEKASQLNESRLDALLQLGKLANAPIQKITDFALEEAVRLTGSTIGYVGFINEDETVFTIHSWSSSVMAECAMQEPDVIFSLPILGLLGEPVRQRQPVITNDYAAPNPLKNGCPPGHLLIERHLSVPVFDGERVVAMAGVGNKEQPYDDSDVRQLTLLMDGMYRLLQRKQQQVELQEAHDSLEQRVRERTAELEDANTALREQMQRRQELEKEVLAISDREQQRMGQELHDGLGQELTGLGYLAETLYSDLKARGAAEAATADQLADGMQKALEQARSISKGLVPVEIHPDGLTAALEQLAQTAENRYGIPCSFRCDRTEPLDDHGAGHQLFRVVQEAVTNAAKHAAASQIAIELVHDDGQITIRVHDNGVGIPGDLDEAAGVGLRIMHHRAAVLGATLEIRPSASGTGTDVICTLPRLGYNRD